MSQYIYKTHRRTRRGGVDMIIELLIGIGALIMGVTFIVFKYLSRVMEIKEEQLENEVMRGVHLYNISWKLDKILEVLKGRKK